MGWVYGGKLVGLGEYHRVVKGYPWVSAPAGGTVGYSNHRFAWCCDAPVQWFNEEPCKTLTHCTILDVQARDQFLRDGTIIWSETDDHAGPVSEDVEREGDVTSRLLPAGPVPAEVNAGGNTTSSLLPTVPDTGILPPLVEDRLSMSSTPVHAGFLPVIEDNMSTSTDPVNVRLSPPAGDRISTPDYPVTASFLRLTEENMSTSFDPITATPPRSAEDNTRKPRKSMTEVLWENICTVAPLIVIPVLISLVVYQHLALECDSEADTNHRIWKAF